MFESKPSCLCPKFCQIVLKKTLHGTLYIPDREVKCLSKELDTIDRNEDVLI